MKFEWNVFSFGLTRDGMAATSTIVKARIPLSCPICPSATLHASVKG